MLKKIVPLNFWFEVKTITIFLSTYIFALIHNLLTEQTEVTGDTGYWVIGRIHTLHTSYTHISFSSSRRFRSGHAESSWARFTSIITVPWPTWVHEAVSEVLGRRKKVCGEPAKPSTPSPPAPLWCLGWRYLTTKYTHNDKQDLDTLLNCILLARAPRIEQNQYSVIPAIVCALKVTVNNLNY